MKERIKQIASENELDYVGIAPVDRFVNAPPEHRPTDLLPGARSVVSMAVKIFKGAQLSMTRGFNHRELRHLVFSYRWFAYGLTNLHFMDRAALLVAQMLEQEGHVAVPIAASGVGYSRDHLQNFSNRHAGVAAGIGELGWNGLCLTPWNGPRQRFVSIITTAELSPDPMYSGAKLCDLKKCIELGQGTPLCVKICPMNAFTREGKKEVDIGGKHMEYAKLDFRACSSVHERIIDTDHPGRLTGPMAPGAEFEPRYQLERLVYKRGHGCGFCLFVCPVGEPEDIKHLMDPELKGRL